MIDVVEESAAILPEYGHVPIAFWVRSRFRVELVCGGLGGLVLVEEQVDPYLKDYDAIGGEGPAYWLETFDLSRWGVLSAFEDSQRIGGAVVAWNTPAVNMLEGRDDLAVLWDLRVHPEHRGRGIGRQLFDCAVAWARERRCRCFKVETQNINVPACRFYAQQGCELGAINLHAYGDASNEVQLLWYLDL
jgi:ribosomal protein S18 acetylase RimI-like enzyme